MSLERKTNLLNRLIPKKCLIDWLIYYHSLLPRSVWKDLEKSTALWRLVIGLKLRKVRITVHTMIYSYRVKNKQGIGVLIHAMICWDASSLCCSTDLQEGCTPHTASRQQSLYIPPLWPLYNCSSGLVPPAWGTWATCDHRRVSYDPPRGRKKQMLAPHLASRKLV